MKPRSEASPSGSATRVLHPGTWSLPVAVSVSVVCVAIGLCLLTAMLSKLTFDLWRPWLAPKQDVSVADIVKFALTVFAGLAGIQALVVAYRRQRDAEFDDSRFVNRFESAARQLGDSEAAVRIAGVQALAGLADAWTSGRQQCVDVLCGYLRLPLPTDDSLTASEGQVRQAVTRVIAQRLTQTAEPSWSSLNFDFTGAHLFNLDLDAVDVVGTLTFDRATFHGTTRIRGGCTFLGDLSMAECTFQGQVLVGDMSVLQAPNHSAEFGGNVWFDGSSFEDGLFLAKPRFRGRVSFMNTYVANIAQVSGALFEETVSFTCMEVATDAFIVSMSRFHKAAIFHDAIVRGRLHLPFNDFHGRAALTFASIGQMQHGNDDVLFRSHFFRPDAVEWGHVPPRATEELDRSQTVVHRGDPVDAPTGALLYFVENDE